MAALAVMLAAADASAAGRRLALVFGIDHYEHLRSLRNAVSDARAVGRALGAIGFDVTLREDGSIDQMDDELEAFADRAVGADLAVFYFAGHGVSVDGLNYLIAADTRVNDMRSLRHSSLDVLYVFKRLLRTGVPAIMLFDACRNDPFGDAEWKDRSVAAFPRERLRPLDRPPPQNKVDQALRDSGVDGNGYVALFSTQFGATASDGFGNHTPFAEAVVSALTEPQPTLFGLLERVDRSVTRVSRRTQRAFLTLGGLSDIALAAPPTGQ